MLLTDHDLRYSESCIAEYSLTFSLYHKPSSYTQAFTCILVHYSLVYSTILKYWDKVDSMYYEATTNKSIQVMAEPKVKYSDSNSNLDDRYQTLIQSSLTPLNIESEQSTQNRDRTPFSLCLNHPWNICEQISLVCQLVPFCLAHLPVRTTQRQYFLSTDNSQRNTPDRRALLQPSPLASFRSYVSQLKHNKVN